MSSDPNTVASLLGRMEKQGLVEREPHWKDRRIRCVVLKKQGRRTYRAMRRVAWKLQQDVLSVLPETERERFLEHLERIARSCWAEAHGAGSILEPTRASGHNTQES
jgi:DNA-binding MarR family transcriptional regulator